MRLRRWPVTAALTAAWAVLTTVSAGPLPPVAGANPPGSSGTPRPAVLLAGPPGRPASAGCGRPPVPGPRSAATATGDLAQALPVGTATRSYRLAVPTGYRSSVAAPLILLFHGSGSDAVQTSIYTQLPKRAARAGYLVATPDAVAGAWQLSPPGAHTGDLAFVTALVADLSSRYCVDRSRIYTAGISLGSEFAAIVGCSAARPIAAVGLVAAEFLLHPCRGPVSVIAFHGTADPVVAYRSGGTGAALPGVPVIGVEQNLARWAHLDRCGPAPHVRRVAPLVVRRTWSGCGGGSAVLLYSVIGGGHTWPGSPINLSTGTFGPTTHQVDATGLMLAFFGHHRLAHR